MAKKKTRKSNKMPEKSISDKVNHYKGVNRTLRKRIENIEKRMYDLEQRMSKYKKLLPDEPECIKYIEPKNADEDVRDDFLRRFHPNFREEE